MEKRCIIITGGGTGGHVFPAIALADALRATYENTTIVFVGAKDGMEEKLVPPAGYPIYLLPIKGFYRQLNLRNVRRNLSIPFKFVRSYLQAKKILRSHRPQLVIGVGGYASLPTLQAARRMKIPYILCEQNAYPGLVNRRFAKNSRMIFLGNEDARHYLPQTSKIIYSGNPVRKNLALTDRAEALKVFQFSPDQPVLLVVGGSLGARAINQALLGCIEKLTRQDIQVLWQCGKIYYDLLREKVSKNIHVRLMPFIEDMNAAYGAANLVVLRAGALTISELIEVSKPAILIPSPNVAEDHQTRNARSLVDKGAAMLIKDDELNEKLYTTIEFILNNKNELGRLQRAISSMHKPQASQVILEKIDSFLS